MEEARFTFRYDMTEERYRFFGMVPTRQRKISQIFIWCCCGFLALDALLLLILREYAAAIVIAVIAMLFVAGRNLLMSWSYKTQYRRMIQIAGGNYPIVVEIFEDRIHAHTPLGEENYTYDLVRRIISVGNTYVVMLGRTKETFMLQLPAECLSREEWKAFFALAREKCPTIVLPTVQ